MSETAVAIQLKGPAMPVPVAEHSESSAILSILERAARDPAVDIDKMERIFEMQVRVRADEARRAYDAAFALMQEELPEIDKRGKIIIRDKANQEKVIQSTPYALWEDTARLIKPILAKYGFGLSFRINQTESRLTTTAVLSRAGHREETSFSAPIDNTGSKNNVQGWGSSFSYGKRYAGTALLNITTRGEDDDGKAAGVSATISDEQGDELRKLMEDFESDRMEGFCKHFKIDKIDDLPAAKFEAAKAAIAKAKRAP